MTTFGEKFRALLATGRVANLPTVWSNVLVAFWLASSFVSDYTRETDGSIFRNYTLLFLFITTSAFYVGGCMLGDARDIHFDRANRPSRPLPQGVLSPSFVTLSAWGLLLFGLFIAAASPLFGGIIAYNVSWDELVALLRTKDGLIIVQAHEILLASLLLVCIVVYAFIHKKNKILAVTLMALCRLLLIIFAISCAHKTFFQNHSTETFFLHRHWAAIWMPLLAATVGLYTLLLSWVASTESKPGVFQFRNILAPCLLALPLVSFILIHLLKQKFNPYFSEQRDLPNVEYFGYIATPPSPIIHFAMLAAFIIWMIYALTNLKRSKPIFVSNALAGFCLLDACMAATFSPILALVCVGLFGLALLLQKFTPAT